MVDSRPSANSARLYLSAILVVFLLGTITNVALDVMTEPSMRSVVIHPSGDLSDVPESELGFGRAYLIAVYLRDIAWGGELVVPDSLTASEYRFRNMADMVVRVENYDPRISPDAVESLSGMPTITGMGNLTGYGNYVPFTIVWKEDGVPVQTFRFWQSDDSVYLIDDRVAPTETAQ